MKAKIYVFLIFTTVTFCISCEETNRKQTDINSTNFESKDVFSSKETFITNLFTESVCQCFSEINLPSTIELAIKKYDNCAISFLNRNQNIIGELIDTLKIINKSPKSKYDKGEYIGKIIAKKGNILLVRNCDIYRKSLIDAKHKLFSDANLNLKDIEETINEFKSAINKSNNPGNLGQTYFLLGMFHEFKSDLTNAKKYYKMSVKIESEYNSIAEILGELLNYKSGES